MKTEATTLQETPAFFPAGENTLFGVLTAPLNEPRGVAVIVLPGGGTPLSVNVNGLSVRLSRRLAALGFHALRFDYHGSGESAGNPDRFRLDQPFTNDLEAAMSWLRGRGIDRFVLVGSCFGARTALATTVHGDDVQGVGLLSMPVRDFEMGERSTTRLAAQLSMWGYVRRAVTPRVVRGLLAKDHRRAYGRLVKEKLRRKGGGDQGEGRYGVSSRLLEELRSLVDSSVPTLFLYGEGDDLLAEFERARSGELGVILKRSSSSVSLVTLRGPVHGFKSVDVQDEVLDVLTDWIDSLPGGGDG